ncbi:MAG: cupin domain-containing protein [Lachnospiraceae bacterium]|nr:cupin domain-containing protein [Lachnospiraceae bacterium]
MQKVNIYDIEGTEFPAGRRTRVILGQNGAITGEKFCQGFVVIYPGGGIPEHDHETVESYTILKGDGIIEVDGEKREVHEHDYVFIPSGKKHSLYNAGNEDMHMMFVYAPGVIVDHWAQEQAGVLE